MAHKIKILFSILWLFVQAQAAAPKNAPLVCEACGPLRPPKVVFHVTFDGSIRSLASYIHNTLDTATEVQAIKAKAPLIMCAAARDIIKHNHKGARLLAPNVPNAFTFQEIWDCKSGIGLRINDFDVTSPNFTCHNIASYRGNCSNCGHNHQSEFKSNPTANAVKIDPNGQKTIK